MDKFFRAKQVCDAHGISRATLWRWVRDGKFPQPVKLGSNSIAWSAVEIERWRAEKMASRAA